MKQQFDSEELRILDNYNYKKLKVSKNIESDIITAKQVAENTIENKLELKIKISANDYKNLKLKELEVGVSSENIISALIHKYLQNRIKISI